MGKAKKILKGMLMKAIPIVLIPITIAVFLAAITYYITIDDGIYDEDDWSSTPYAASSYINGATMETDGTIKSNTTAEELWNQMIDNGSRVDKYLSNPKELARLMKAEIVTQYPDTRKNPDKEIKWKDIIEDEDKLQGIVKFKRTDTSNNTSTMTYVDPVTFQGYIDEYNGTGSEKAKQNALTHFTLKKSTISTTSNRGNSSGSGSNVDENKLYFIGDSWIERLRNSGVAKTVYFYGQVGKYAGQPEMSLSSIPEKTDASAIVLYLGVNNPETYGDMNSLIDELISKYSGKTIYVVEVAHVNPDKYTGDVKNSAIDIYNEKVKAHCEETNNAKFLEVASSVEDSSGKLANSDDGLHLNNCQDWYDSIISAIKGNGSTSNNNTSSSSNSNTNNKNNSNSNNTSGKQKETVTQVDGDGYSEEYTSSAGITYKAYKQFEGSYSGNRYWRSNPNGTISSSGCGPTSVAILASGLVDPNITPAETAASMYERHGYTGAEYLKEEMDSRGMTSEIITGPSAEDIQNNLRNGKVMLVSVNSATKFTSESHIMTIVDINEEGQVYISNPSSHTNHGWTDVSEILKGCDYIVTTDAGASGVASSTSSSSTSGYVAVVATWNQTNTTLETNDPNVSAYSTTNYSMTTTTVNYRGMVDRYAMPFDFLWALLVVGEEKDFVFELADLVYGSDIQVTIYDNLTTNTNIDSWTYDQETKSNVDIRITGSYPGQASISKPEDNHEDPVTTNSYSTKKTIVTYTNTINQVLTKADTWIVDYTNNYTYSEPENSSSESTVTQDDQDFPTQPTSTDSTYSCEHTEAYKQEIIEEYAKSVGDTSQSIDLGDGSSAGGTVVAFNTSLVTFEERYSVRNYTRYVNISDAVTNNTETKKFTEGTPDVREKTSADTDKNGKPKELNFVTIYRKAEHIQARKNINSVAEWLFEIVETNGKPDVDLVKYLLYKATGKKYGVTKYVFSEYDASKFTSVGEFYGDSFEEKVWWALIDAGYSKIAAAGALGNFKAESGVKANCVQGDYQQPNPTQYDEDYTNKVDSGAISRDDFIYRGPGGEGYGLAQWTSHGRKAGLYDFAKKRGVSIADEDMQIEYLLGEMEPNNGGADGCATAQFGLGNIGAATARSIYMSASSPEEAADAFFKYFERAGDSSGSIRQQNAREYYNKFGSMDKPNSSALGQKIVSTAETKLGCRYVYGAAGPNEFDCSGLVQWVFNQNGISLPRTTVDYFKYVGTKNEVSWNEAQPGDVVWKDDGNNNGHVGIYIGNDKYLHAPQPGDVVKISQGAKGAFFRVFRFTK